jgi:hypothetical protein
MVLLTSVKFNSRIALLESLGHVPYSSDISSNLISTHVPRGGNVAAVFSSGVYRWRYLYMFSWRAFLYLISTPCSLSTQTNYPDLGVKPIFAPIISAIQLSSMLDRFRV